jgi:cell division protease FtsH
MYKTEAKTLFFICLFQLSNGLLLTPPANLLRNSYYYPKVPFTKLINQIDEDKITDIYVSSTLDTIVSKQKTSASSTESETESYLEYSTTKINPFIIKTVVDESVKHNVNTVFLEQPPTSFMETGLKSAFGFAESFIIPTLFLSFIISIFRNSNFGQNMPPMPGMSNRKLDADKNLVSKMNISLNSFAGSPELFEECIEVVSYLKNDTLYKMAGAEIPRGILLEGPPGTGKTLLAKAIASEADANFISIAASEFVELFVGMGAAKVRNFFKTARENKPCILFIDEIDSVGRQRGSGINMANDEREQTLNQLLAEMDGFADNDGVLIIAATNRKDILDSALLRPGRFDRTITISLPDKESRRAILDVHTQNKQLDADINLDLVAELTNGFSGAQLKNLMNEAAISASKRGEIVIQETDIMNSLDKLLVGIVKRTDTRSDESKRRIAIHEIGHAFLAAQFREYFELKKVTIQSTYNGAGGYTIFSEHTNLTESGLYTKDLLFKRLVIGMGGKAAESIFYGDDHVSVGAVQDLKQTNSLAQRMIGNFGMGNDLETFYNENVDSERTPFVGRTFGMGDKYSDKTKESFDKESLFLVDKSYQMAKEVLSENRTLMELLIEKLLADRTMYGKDFMSFMETTDFMSSMETTDK